MQANLEEDADPAKKNSSKSDQITPVRPRLMERRSYGGSHPIKPNIQELTQTTRPQSINHNISAHERPHGLLSTNFTHADSPKKNSNNHSNELGIISFKTARYSSFNNQFSTKSELRAPIQDLSGQKQPLRSNQIRLSSGVMNSNDLSSVDKKRKGRTQSTIINGGLEQTSLQQGLNHAQLAAKSKNNRNPQLRKSYGDRTEVESVFDSDCDEFLEVIRTAEPNSTINLPNTIIKVNRLLIDKPLKFVGSPEAFLEISHSISIDLSAYSLRHGNKVQFTECNIHFKYNPKSAIISPRSLTRTGSKNHDELSYAEKKKSFAGDFGLANQESIRRDLLGQFNGEQTENKEHSLFIVNRGAILEMLDCEIKSLNFEREMAFEVPSVKDIAFLLKNPRNNGNMTDQGAIIDLKNCRINRFETAVQCGFKCSVFLEKCSILDCRGHAINLSNPQNFTQRDSTIDASGKSSINIRFSKATESQIESEIIIENNEILNSNSYGISIFGENMIHHNCNIIIQKNRLKHAKKDGIGIKNLNIRSVKVLSNVIAECKGNGLMVQNVIDESSSGQLELQGNKISHCRLYGLTMIDSSFLSNKDEFMANDKGGVIIACNEESIEITETHSLQRKNPIRCIFNDSNFNNNKDSGLIIVGQPRGPIILSSCNVFDNINGIFINLKSVAKLDENENIQETNDQINSSLGQILLDKCSIFRNHENGMCIKSLGEKLFFRETHIQENKNFAINLATEWEKKFLVFEKGKLRNYVDGLIGGENWSLSYNQNENVCKQNRCLIF